MERCIICFCFDDIVDLIDDFYRENEDLNNNAILTALKSGKICLLNPISSAAGDFKNIHTLLKSPQINNIFNDEEKKVIQECIPMTVPFSQSHLELALKNKDRFIIKPNLGFGGKGVVIGKETSGSDWKRILEASLAKDFTLQEYIDIPESNFPEFHEMNFLNYKPKKVNINFWVVDGVFCSSFARISDKSVINVSQGGAILPIAWI